MNWSDIEVGDYMMCHGQVPDCIAIYEFKKFDDINKRWKVRVLYGHGYGYPDFHIKEETYIGFCKEDGDFVFKEEDLLKHRTYIKLLSIK
jgi:hypothetical protein